MTEKIKPSNICDATLPVGWECARFRKLFSFGKGLSITKEDLVDEGVPVISYGQVHSKANTGTSIHESLIRFVPESYLKTDKQALTQEGNFIFADTSEDLSGVGNCAFVNTTETLFAGYHSIIARPKDTNMYPKYFAYQFVTDIWRDQIRAKVMGVKVFSISQKLLRDTTVFIPPIQEQKAIAKLLDTKCTKIDSVIADIEKQIETLQKYKKSLITEAVTKGLDRSVPMKDSGIEWIGSIPEHWQAKRLSYECERIGDIDHYMPDSVDKGIPYIMTGDLIGDGNEMDFENCKQISEQDYQRLSRKMKPIVNDIIFARYATIGTVRIVDFDRDFLVSYSCAIIRPKKSLHSKYLFYYLKSNAFYEEISKYINTNTQGNVGIDSLSRAKTPIPRIEEQIAISEFLDKKCGLIDDVLSAKKRQLETILQHKKSLIYEYVTGKKRVTEVN